MLLMRCQSVLIVAAFAVIAINHAILQAQPPLSPVVVAPVVSREIEASQTFVGTVTPRRTATVGSAVDGRVVEFLVNEGDHVKAGQPLAKLLTSTIRLELAAAEGELDLRRQELAELENGTRPEEIEQANARMEAVEARSKFLENRRKRIESLFASGRASSIDERDQAVTDAVEAAQLYREAKAALQMAVNGPRQEKIAQARSRVAIQVAQTEKLKDQVSKHTIVSGFDGYITAEHSEVGEWVQRGDPVAEVTALAEVEVLAHVVERNVPFVQLNSRADVIIPALDNERFSGTVVLVVPQADRLARTFPVKIRITNRTDATGPVLKSGMYAQVLLPTGSIHKATLVPKDAIVLGGPQPIVFTIPSATTRDQRGKAKKVAVELGISDGSWIQVAGELESGDLVVVQGNERLQPGQEVQVVRSIQPNEANVQPTPPASTETN